MQPNEDRNEGQLKGLLWEWEIPDAPADLEQRVMRQCTPRYRNWWRLLFTGYIRVPVALLYVLVALMTVTIWKVGAHGPPAPCVAVAQSTPAGGGSRTAALPEKLGKPNRCDHAAPGFC